MPMSEKFPQKAQDIMNERFHRDTLIALGTVEDNVPYVRTVNGYGTRYEIDFGNL